VSGLKAKRTGNATSPEIPEMNAEDLCFNNAGL